MRVENYPILGAIPSRWIEIEVWWGKRVYNRGSKYSLVFILRNTYSCSRPIHTVKKDQIRCRQTIRILFNGMTAVEWP